MKMRHLHILFLVLAFLLSGLTHSVKAEASKEKKDDKAHELVIKAQTDALMPFTFAVDVLAPADFLVLPVYCEAAVNVQTPASTVHVQSPFLKTLLTRIQPSMAP